MIVTGITHLTLFAIKQAPLEAHHPVKKLGEPITSIALFPIGLIQLFTLFSYWASLYMGNRVPTDPWGVLGTVFYSTTMLGGGFSAFSQIGRKVPWAVFMGAGTAIIGGGAIYHAASGANLSTAPVLAGSAFIGIVLYVAMFFITLPWATALNKLGNITANSTVVMITAVLSSVLGVLSGIGLVVL